MIRNQPKLIAYLAAILAAMSNASVGIFSFKLLALGINPYMMVCFKCIIATGVLFIWIMFTKQIASLFFIIKNKAKALMTCAIFLLLTCVFETMSYAQSQVPAATFIMLASAVITTLIANALIGNKKFKFLDGVVFMLIMFGLWNLLNGHMHISITQQQAFIHQRAIWFAFPAGFCYGMFLILGKQLQIGYGSDRLCYIFFIIGAILIVPVMHDRVVTISVETVILLVGLALLPTVGGLWLTSYAIEHLPSHSVQILELSEPVFSLMFAFCLLDQKLLFTQIVGAVCIATASYLHVRHCEN